MLTLVTKLFLPKKEEWGNLIVLMNKAPFLGKYYRDPKHFTLNQLFSYLNVTNVQLSYIQMDIRYQKNKEQKLQLEAPVLSENSE